MFYHSNFDEKLPDEITKRSRKHTHIKEENVKNIIPDFK